MDCWDSEHAPLILTVELKIPSLGTLANQVTLSFFSLQGKATRIASEEILPSHPSDPGQPAIRLAIRSVASIVETYFPTRFSPAWDYIDLQALSKTFSKAL